MTMGMKGRCMRLTEMNTWEMYSPSNMQIIKLSFLNLITIQHLHF